MLIIFSKQFTHKDVFFIPGMFLQCKRNQRNVRNWKVTDRNWPCVAPIGFQIFGTPVSPVGGDLAVIGGLEHPRICSIPKYRPGFPPMDGKPPHRPFVISLKTTVLARTVPLTMHLRCIFYRNHSQLHWRPCIYSPYWMTLLNVFCWKQDIACTLTEWGRKKGWFSAVCYRRSGRFKMMRFPTADNGALLVASQCVPASFAQCVCFGFPALAKQARCKITKPPPGCIGYGETCKKVPAAAKLLSNCCCHLFLISDGANKILFIHLSSPDWPLPTLYLGQILFKPTLFYFFFLNINKSSEDISYYLFCDN